MTIGGESVGSPATSDEIPLIYHVITSGFRALWAGTAIA